MMASAAAVTLWSSGKKQENFSSLGLSTLKLFNQSQQLNSFIVVLCCGLLNILKKEKNPIYLSQSLLRFLLLVAGCKPYINISCSPYPFTYSKFPWQSSSQGSNWWESSRFYYLPCSSNFWFYTTDIANLYYLVLNWSFFKRINQHIVSGLEVISIITVGRSLAGILASIWGSELKRDLRNWAKFYLNSKDNWSRLLLPLGDYLLSRKLPNQFRDPNGNLGFYKGVI